MIFIIAADYTDKIVVGGGALGILSFILAFAKVWSSDRVWRALVKEVRDELKDCRDGRLEQTRVHAEDRATWRIEKADLETEVRVMRSEVISLRRFVHADFWTGTDPESVRERVFDQEDKTKE